MSSSFYDQLAVWSQVAGSVAFLIVLVYLFRRFVVPAVVAAQEHKNAELEEAVRRRDAAREQVDVAQREGETVAQYCDAIRDRGTRDAERERARIIAEATSEGQRLVRNADGELDRARAAARDTLRLELLAKALEIARQSAAGIAPETDRRIAREVMNAALEGAAR